MANGTKSPKGWLIAALICFLLGIAGCGGSVVVGITTFASLADDVANTTPMGQQVTFQANAGGRAGVLLERTAVCQGTDDSGNPITFDSLSGSTTVNADNQEFTDILTFETDEGTSYTLSCGRAGEGDYTVLQLPAILSSGLGVALLAGGALLGGFLIFLSIIFLIVGLVRRSSWKKRNQGPPAAAYGAPAGAVPPPPGAPGGAPPAPGHPAVPPAPPAQQPPPAQAPPAQAPPPPGQSPGQSPGWGETPQAQPPQDPPSFGGGAPPPPPPSQS